jgi:succinate dehydrogenase/fumarate reductase flavoprotein subunit
MSGKNGAAVERVYDVIVVGGGGAGLMAALSAARYGRAVLLLEKGQQLGGTTGLSVGTICSSSTPHQRALGIDDCPDEHFEDMAKFAGPLVHRDNPALRRLLVDNVPETFQELMDLGIEFTAPIPEPPHRYPRLHAVVPHARSFIQHIARACRKHGVTIRTGIKAERLSFERDRVTGIEASEGGTTRRYRARRAVILASGDFSAAALPYKQRFMSGPLLTIGGINPLSTGDGQRMGEEIGSEVINGDLAWGPEMRFLPPRQPSVISRLPTWRIVAKAILMAMKHAPKPLLRPFLMGFVTTFLAPSHALFREGAILVNSKGERFCDELDRPQDHVGLQPDQLAYIVLDARVAAKFRSWPNYISTAPGVGYAYLQDYERCRRDVCCKADSLDALAEAIKVPREGLRKTANNIVSAAAHAAGAAVPMNPPFYAMGPAKSWIVFSEGGLRVNERLQVLSKAGEPIEGLYAAGSAGQGGVLLEGHGHHLGWAFTSGRLAGRHAALLKPHGEFGAVRASE